jgi:uncharacterized membrane protein YkgB
MGRRTTGLRFAIECEILTFMANGWAASAGGFPAMAGNVPFLMKDVVLFAASVYLVEQDFRQA